MVSLIVNPKHLDSLKCLIAAKWFDSVKINIQYHSRSNVLPLLQGRVGKRELSLYDPASICLYLCQKSKQKVRPNSFSQLLQWISFSNSELRPFRNFKGKQANDHLNDILHGLNTKLSKSKFLVNNEFGLADIFVAVEFLPHFSKSISSNGKLTALAQWFQIVANHDVFKSIVDYKEYGGSKKKQKMPEGEKFKILCLHGYRQNIDSFKEKLGAFRKIVGKKSELVFINAPHKIQGVEEERGWWFSTTDGSFEAHEKSDCDRGFEESVRAVQSAFRDHGPFDGIFAFSQGAALLLILCMRKHELNLDFKFAMFVAPFISRSLNHAKWFTATNKIEVPSLLVIGDSDKVIEREMSDEVLEFFENARIVRHPGGHFVPASGEQKKAYSEFLEEMSTK